MNKHYADSIADLVFIERKCLFKRADVVLYHPGHFPELNESIKALYDEGGFDTIMIPSIQNNFLNENEYTFHKNILISLGIPGEIIFPIEGEAGSVKDIVRNAMTQMNHQTKILLAGKSFFCRRFLLLASLYACSDMVLDVYPIEDKRGINKDKWTLSDKGIQRIMNEVSQINQIIHENLHGQSAI